MHAKKLHHFYMHFTFGKHYSDVIFNSQHALVHKLTCIFSILVMHQSFVIIINMQHIVSGLQHNSDDHSKWFIETRDFNVCFNMSLILFKWWYLTVCQLLMSSLISLRHACDRLVSNGPCSCELQDAFCACEKKVAIFSTFAMPQARENIKSLDTPEWKQKTENHNAGKSRFTATEWKRDGWIWCFLYIYISLGALPGRFRTVKVIKAAWIAARHQQITVSWQE